MTDIDKCTELIQLLSAKLRAYYVFPDTAEKICAGLQNHLENGDYNDISDEEALKK